MERFEYPEDVSRFLRVRGVEELKERLRAQAKYLNINRQNYQLSYIRNRYIYARCKCSAYLRYFKKTAEEEFQLIKYSTVHEHPHNNGSGIVQYMRSLPANLQPSTMFHFVREMFGCSKSCFYYNLHKIENSRASIQSILQELDGQKYEIRHEPFPLMAGQIPSILILSSPTMIELFKRFGQFITFDLTYNLIKEFEIESQTRKRKWGLGVIAGKNSHNNPIIFSIVIMNRETTADMRSVFQSFFDVVSMQPEVIITDQQTSIISALEQLKAEAKWSGSHLLDSYHILKNLKKRTKNSRLYENLHESIVAIYEADFQKAMDKAKGAIDSPQDAKIFDQFLKDSPRYCYSQTESHFQGVSLSTSYHEKIHDKIKDCIKYQQSAAVVIKKMAKIALQINEQAQSFKIYKVPIEEMFESNQLKLCRYSVCEVIFKKIVTNYIKCLPLAYHQSQRKWSFQCGEAVIVMGDKLVCSCKYWIRSGLPCIHLHKIIKDIREEIVNYVHPRWKIQLLEEKRSSNSFFSKPGRPRLSRRNRG